MRIRRRGNRCIARDRAAEPPQPGHREDAADSQDNCPHPTMIASGRSARPKSRNSVIARHQGELVAVENPTTTLEELFLGIVRDSEARPGRRAPQPDEAAARP